MIGSLANGHEVHAHRHFLPVPGELAVTVFVTGPRVRDWGFLCPKGWRPWQEFVASDAKGERGAGCGEVD